MTVLTTPRLTLRPATIADVDAFHAILSDPRAMRYWATLPHTDIGQTRDWVEKMVATAPPEGEDWVIVHQGHTIGKAGLWRFPAIGYILHPDMWGRGLATEALAAVIAHVFATHRLPAIEADVDPRNHGSLRVLGKLGFVETGRAERTMQLGDEWCDSVYLRLSAPPL